MTPSKHYSNTKCFCALPRYVQYRDWL